MRKAYVGVVLDSLSKPCAGNPRFGTGRTVSGPHTEEKKPLVIFSAGGGGRLLMMTMGKCCGVDADMKCVVSLSLWDLAV